MSAPKLLEQPQWMCDQDVVDFGRVRPDRAVERMLTVTNVGAGTANLHILLRTESSWLQFRVGDEWRSEIQLPEIPAGSDQVVVLRADPAQAQGRYDVSNSAQIAVSGTRFVNYAPGDLALRARAQFLAPRSLHLEPHPEEMPDFPVQPDADPRNLSFQAEPVPQGTTLPAVVGLRCSDGKASNVRPSGVSVKEGSAHWLDWEITGQGAQQTLHIRFFTANRPADQTYSVVLEVADEDPFIQPAQLRLRVPITPPPLLESEGADCTLARGEQEQVRLQLENKGFGPLRIDYAEVEESAAAWLSIEPCSDLVVPPGARAEPLVSVNTANLSVGCHVGRIRVFCNHRGRAVRRSIPVRLHVIPQAIRCRIDWKPQTALERGRSKEVSIDIGNASSQKAVVRLKAQALPPLIVPWLAVQPNGTITLEPNTSFKARLILSSSGIDMSTAVAEGAVELWLDSYERPVWRQVVSARIVPKSGFFGWFRPKS